LPPPPQITTMAKWSWCLLSSMTSTGEFPNAKTNKKLKRTNSYPSNITNIWCRISTNTFGSELYESAQAAIFLISAREVPGSNPSFLPITAPSMDTHKFTNW